MNILACLVGSLLLLSTAFAEMRADDDSVAESPDRNFITMVAQTDLAEIQIGKLALQKERGNQVTILARKLIDEQTKMLEVIALIASSRGIELPASPHEDHSNMATKLKSESGNQFARDFLVANSSCYHKVAVAFKKEIKSGRDSTIKGFAAEFLPLIRQHTKMIDQAKKDIGK